MWVSWEPPAREILRIAVYNHNAGIYGQNKHAYANLRQILGLEQVALVFGGLTQPPKLRAAAGLPCQSGDFGRIEVDISRFWGHFGHRFGYRFQRA